MKPRKPSPGPKPKSEHSDQVRLVMYLRTFHPKVLVASVPNGAAVSSAHRMRLLAEGMLPGFPDLVVCEPRAPFHGLFVEMKSTAKTAKLSEDQVLVHERLRRKGYCVFTCHGYEDAKTAVEQYLLLGEDHAT